MNHPVLHAIVDGLVFGVAGLAIVDDIRLRRRARFERLAREAEDALGPPRIGDIDMPDPCDPRWAPRDVEFVTAVGTTRKHRTLGLGEVNVRDTGWVYIGDGAALDNSMAYGQRVLRAYKQRLVNAVRSSP